MKIAVNTRLLIKNRLEGIGWFTYENLKRICRAHPEHEFYFIFDRPYHQDFIFSDNITPIVLFPPSRHPLLWYWFFQISMKKYLNKLKPDVFVSPESYLPLGLKIPRVITMHDIAYEHYPETVPVMVRWYYKYFFPRFAQNATRIMTVSEYSKQDIMKYYHVSPAKIDVVYNGYNLNFTSIEEAQKIKIRAAFSNGAPYFVFLGGLYPRKNIGKLMEAFERFKSTTGSNYKLLLVGKHVFGTDELLQMAHVSSYKEDIIFTGRIDNFETLNNLIASAEAMTYVSVFEGFGIPCLEAMQCGIPVITSNTSSLPEVCGDAAIYVNPLEVESIAQGMLRLYQNPELRISLTEAANMQLKKFSWEHTAAAFWNSILTTINT